MSDILEFLPVYSNIKKESNDVLNTYNNFSKSIYNKKEFVDEKIIKNEPPSKDKLSKSQKFIKNFLSSYTPYDQILLFHEMGVGKSRASIGTIENIKKEKYSFDGAIIIAKGTNLLDNYKNEITEYTDDYFPPNYNLLPEKLKKRRLNASLRKFYDFRTFETFSNELAGFNDEKIKQDFSNKIIVIDEVHNITEDLSKNTSNIWYYDEKDEHWINPLSNEKSKEKPKNINKKWQVLFDKDNRITYKNTKSLNPVQYIHPYNVNIYKEIHRLLHLVKNCKVILMSGTPMNDSFQEIASLMNLILPLKEQLPVKKDFIKLFFDKSGDFYNIKKDKIKDLKEKFKGRVSYLKAVTSEIQKTFEGEKVQNLKYFTTFPLIMKDKQTEIYKEVIVKDSKKFINVNIEDLSTEIDDDDLEFESSFNDDTSRLDESSDDNNDDNNDDDDEDDDDEDDDEDDDDDDEDDDDDDDDDNDDDDDDKDEIIIDEERQLANVENVSYFFNREDKNIDLKQLKFTKRSIYEITPWKEANVVSRNIKKYFNYDNITITDATASIGGNSISFLNNGFTVNSVEIDPNTCSFLKNNISTFKYDTNKVICGDYTEIFRDLLQDVVFFDPPWGGKEYNNYSIIDMFLSDINIIDLIKTILDERRAKLVVLKSPVNFDENSLINKLNDYFIDKKLIMRKSKVSYVVYYISIKDVDIEMAEIYKEERIISYIENNSIKYGIISNHDLPFDNLKPEFIYVLPIIVNEKANSFEDMFKLGDIHRELLPKDIFMFEENIKTFEQLYNKILSDKEEIQTLTPQQIGKRKRFKKALSEKGDKLKKKLFLDGAKKEENSTFYYNSRHVSLFVFPDGSYGKTGFNKYVTVSKDGNYKLTNELKNSIAPMNADTETKLKNLENMSVKFAYIIRKLLNAYDNKKSSFVYCNSVTGGGIILFSLILGLFGFSKSVGHERTKGKRFGLFLSGKTDFNELKNMFNEPKNKYGEYISVIIGSQAISQGLSFKNIREEHIITPHFNYSEIEQAIARGFRYGSHRTLLIECKKKLNKKGYEYDLDALDDFNQLKEDCVKENIEYPDLKVYQYVALPNDSKITSVDVKFYKISEIKDVNIKKVERIMKESAVDCYLNKDRNLLENYEKMRECEYLECQYQCDDISESYVPTLDISTHFAYYFRESDDYKIIKDNIASLFRIYFKIDFKVLKTFFPEIKHSYLVQVLYDMISKKEIVFNKYNIPCYIRESNNLFYLTDDFANDNALDVFYNQYPNVISNNSFENTYKEIVAKNIPNIIKDIFKLDVNKRNFPENILGLINKLDEETQETLLEYCIIAKESKINDDSSEIRDYILNKIFNSKFKLFDNIYISWLLFDDKINNYDSLRCLRNNSDEWEQCNEDEVKLFLEKDVSRDVEYIKNNPYGYYGIFEKNKKTNEINFKLVKILEQKTTKKNIIPTGKVCSSYEMFELIDLLMKLEVDPSTLKEEERKRWELLNKQNINDLKNGKWKKALKTKIDEINHDLNKIKNYIFWYDFDRKVICKVISESMNEKGIILS